MSASQQLSPGTEGSARARRKRALAAVTQALLDKGVTEVVLASLPTACLSDASLRHWQASVRELAMVKNRRRLVSSTLIDVIRVLVMEMRLPFAALEALTEVRTLSGEKPRDACDTA